METRKPLEVNVSLQGAPSSKGACAPGLVRKYKVKYLIFPTSTTLSSPPSPGGKEKRKNRTIMIPSRRVDGWKWLPLIRWPILTPWEEQEACVIHRCSAGKRELGLAEYGPKASHHGLPRLPHLMTIPGLHLRPTDFASLGVRWRDLSCCTWKSEDHCCRSALSC